MDHTIAVIIFGITSIGIISITPIYAEEFALYIPEKMMSDFIYEGMIITKEPVNEDTTINLATSSTSIKFPEIVILERGKNHAIFEIEPDASENIDLKMYAVTTGQPIEATSTIYAYSDRPTALLLSGPGDISSDIVSTSADIIPMKVFLVDNHDRPTLATHDVVITLSSSSDLEFSTQVFGFETQLDVIIPAGSFYTDFVVRVPGDGTIYALSEKLRSDDIGVEHVNDGTNVIIRILPIPAAKNTVGYYSVWLEKNDKLFIPDESVSVRLSTSNEHSLLFDNNTGNKKDAESIKWDTLENGFAIGTVFFADTTPTDSPVNVTAVVDGYGSANTQVAILELLEINDPIYDEDGNVETEIETVTAFTCAWIIPNTPANMGWIIVGTFGTHGSGAGSCPEEVGGLGETPDEPTTSNDTQEEEQENTPGDGVADFDDTGEDGGLTGDDVDDTPDPPANTSDVVQPETQDGTIRPMSVDYINKFRALEIGLRPSTLSNNLTGPDLLMAETYLSAGDEISFEENYTFNFPTGAVMVPFHISTNLGESSDISHIITSIQGGIANTIEFSSGAQYGKDNVAMITSIPSRLNEPGDLAYLYVISGQGGVIVDTISDEKQKAARVVQMDDGISSIDISPFWKGGVTTVRGEYVETSSMIQPLIPETESASVDIAVSGKGESVELWMPDEFFNRNEFPATAHLVDSRGNPVEKLNADDLLINSATFTTIPAGDNFRLITTSEIQSGSLTVIATDVYLGEREFTVHTNPSDQIYAEHAGSDTIKLGSEILVGILTGAMPDPMVMISGNKEGCESCNLDFVENEDGTYGAIPEEEGNYIIEIEITNDGWDPYAGELQWLVEHMVKAKFEALADDGVALPVQMTISGDIKEKEIERTLDNGDETETLAGVYQVSLPTEYEFSSDRKYVLTDLKQNEDTVPFADTFSVNLDKDITFSASYQRTITIFFDTFLETEEVTVEISGNGQYRYGDMVSITAEPASELFGLIWHIPSKWTGLPNDSVISGGTAQFEALNSAEGYVEYETNYTVLILLITISTIIPIVVIRIRSPDMLLDLADMFANLKSKLSKPKIKKEKTESKKKLGKPKFGGIMSKFKKGGSG